MNPKGGTEILKEQLIAQLSKESLEGINLIGSICHPSLIEKDKINVVWQHLSYDQPNVQYMRDRKYVDSVDYFIYVSNWQYNKFREQFQIPEYKSFVIKNATHASACTDNSLRMLKQNFFIYARFVGKAFKVCNRN